jgi:UDP-N-acetylglucosamine pyrophosphorylase
MSCSNRMRRRLRRTLPPKEAVVWEDFGERTDSLAGVQQARRRQLGVPRAAVILAAGKGKRMKSDIPKVLHRIDGRPLLDYVIVSIKAVHPQRIYVVVGFGAKEVMRSCRHNDVVFIMQEEQLGTGHAVMQCEKDLSDFEGTIIVLNGDVPGLKPATIEKFLDFHEGRSAAATVLTAVLDDPTGYGRVLKDGQGSLLKIVEEKDADLEEKRIKEINSGLFCFEKDVLFATLKEISRENAQNEYYLTDVIGVMRNKNLPVAAYCTDDPGEVEGINTLEELKQVSEYIKRKGK